VQYSTVRGADETLFASSVDSRLELLLIFSAVSAAVLLLIVGSIIGISRAMRRRRRGHYSRGAVALAGFAASTTTVWLLFWVGNSLYQNANPVDGLLAINLALCVLPFAWLLSAVRANNLFNEQRLNPSAPFRFRRGASQAVSSGRNCSKPQTK